MNRSRDDKPHQERSERHIDVAPEQTVLETGEDHRPAALQGRHGGREERVMRIREDRAQEWREPEQQPARDRHAGKQQRQPRMQERMDDVRQMLEVQRMRLEGTQPRLEDARRDPERELPEDEKGRGPPEAGVPEAGLMLMQMVVGVRILCAFPPLVVRDGVVGLRVRSMREAMGLLRIGP